MSVSEEEAGRNRKQRRSTTNATTKREREIRDRHAALTQRIAQSTRPLPNESQDEWSARVNRLVARAGQDQERAQRRRVKAARRKNRGQ